MLLLLAALTGLLLAGCDMGLESSNQMSLPADHPENLVRFVVRTCMIPEPYILGGYDKLDLPYCLQLQRTTQVTTNITVSEFSSSSILQAWIADGTWTFRLEAFPAGTTDFYSGNSVFLYTPEIQVFHSVSYPSPVQFELQQQWISRASSVTVTYIFLPVV